MGKPLSKAARAAAPKGLPGGSKKAPQSNYPMPDKKHARLAKSGASRAERVGNISPAQKAQIDRRADRILGKPKGSARKK